ncbi:hypothetical protein TspCOW1_27050 [Thiohalobacter sp. COW1]|uniref:DUF2971 domain-containing protein n=1 Tax=Thiohalobacter sp. COW1 TaxID=2795687 RepID=UPI001916B99A|nr:DUF2971 domain-containing protein [Thiohalobacter sp. COW1]BCO32602.1 hypothetical protein TspCOW1_27050 [Thiohalobacter sp. COW1]
MRVYHLLSAQFGITNIALSRIKISRYDDLNDPFELLAGELSEKELRGAVSAMKKDFNETKGLICFSKNWENPVLWSHYADKHHGMALGFDIPDKYASEVHYSPDRIPVEYVGGNKSNGIEPSYVQKITSTKYKHWEYEDEIRMHVGLDEGTCEGGLYFMPFSNELKLREVVLGHSCPIPIDQIRALLKELHPEAKAIKARLAFRSFRVVTNQRYVEK